MKPKTKLKLLRNRRIVLEKEVETRSLWWAASTIEVRLHEIGGHCAVLSSEGNVTRIHCIRRFPHAL